jgi:hypothetical protein
MTQKSDEPWRCLRAPLPDRDLLSSCLAEKQPYEVHVGESFLVTGTATGTFVSLQANPATHECEVPPVSSELVRLDQSRIPLEPPLACPATLTDPLGPLPPSLGTNVCRLPDGDGRRIHFENPIFGIAVEVPAAAPLPPDQLVLSFNVVGGGLVLGVALAVDVQAQQPRAALTAPDLQTVYVVDEGKQSVATGLRGQLLRLSSSVLQVDHNFQVR